MFEYEKQQQQQQNREEKKLPHENTNNNAKRTQRSTIRERDEEKFVRNEWNHI